MSDKTKIRKPKLRTLVGAFAFHLANLLGMDEDDEELVKKYHSLIDEYVKHIEYAEPTPGGASKPSLRQMKEAIEGMLRISDLWLPKVADEEHLDETQALHCARLKMLDAIKDGSKGISAYLTKSPKNMEMFQCVLVRS